MKKKGKKLGNLLKSPVTTAVLFVIAAGLLLFSGIGGARAALTYFSETYSSRVQMYDIGVTLQENGKDISWRNYNSAGDGSWNEATGALVANLLEEGESLKLGKAYPEELRVTNSGNINQYVRVKIYKYWVDPEGNKMQSLSPGLIGLHLLCDKTGSDNGWLLDEEASTAERTVLYYNRLLYAEGEGESISPAFTDTLTIDDMLATKVTQTTKEENGYTTITTTYDYNGVKFNIEAEVDAVQEHNAADAIESAWGRKVSVEGGRLQLQGGIEDEE